MLRTIFKPKIGLEMAQKRIETPQPKSSDKTTKRGAAEKTAGIETENSLAGPSGLQLPGRNP